jgi:NAD(P)H-hydrate epimerase
MSDKDKIKRIIKSLYVQPRESRKGQNGKLLIIGGSRHYHGAPMLSILAARRFVDLLYFYPAENDYYLINTVKTIPEVIVVYDLEKINESDCVLFGVGIAHATVDIDFILKNAKKLVIDGDGLKMIKEKLCELKQPTILTPHEGEFKFLFECEGKKENVKKMADSYGVVILKKDPKGDIISDGKRTIINTTHNQGMTRGGTGDVLAGLCGALFCKNEAFDAAVASAYINGYSGEVLKKRYGYNFCASDLANTLAESYKKIKGLIL